MGLVKGVGNCQKDPKNMKRNATPLEPLACVFVSLWMDNLCYIHLQKLQSDRVHLLQLITKNSNVKA
ncbi:hypothetical protein SLEP1_g50049 [Rubroshorea leprosula]|uniref:Uncharacterized protein n=1 Tax=Rubroshorea leprosula TaxID=152421 RepID=A0AAV5M192_9ROSI|nr:hypothetical protein SLEP1_g50049 [Rubroshorea leprosula]